MPSTRGNLNWSNPVPAKVNMMIVRFDSLPLSPFPKLRGLKKVFFLGPSTERSIACVVWLNKSSSSNTESSGGRQQRLDSPPLRCCCQTCCQTHYKVRLLTADLQVTVVYCHVPSDPHVAPGAFHVIVGVAAFVCSQSDFRDELLVFTESLHLGCGPWQTHMACHCHIKIASVVQAVVGKTLNKFDSLGGDGRWNKFLTFD